MPSNPEDSEHDFSGEDFEWETLDDVVEDSGDEATEHGKFRQHMMEWQMKSQWSTGLAWQKLGPDFEEKEVKEPASSPRMSECGDSAQSQAAETPKGASITDGREDQSDAESQHHNSDAISRVDDDDNDYSTLGSQFDTNEEKEEDKKKVAKQKAPLRHANDSLMWHVDALISKLDVSEAFYKAELEVKNEKIRQLEAALQKANDSASKKVYAPDASKLHHPATGSFDESSTREKQHQGSERPSSTPSRYHDVEDLFDYLASGKEKYHGEKFHQRICDHEPTFVYRLIKFFACEVDTLSDAIPAIHLEFEGGGKPLPTRPPSCPRLLGATTVEKHRFLNQKSSESFIISLFFDSANGEECEPNSADNDRISAVDIRID